MFSHWFVERNKNICVKAKDTTGFPASWLIHHATESGQLDLL